MDRLEWWMRDGLQADSEHLAIDLALLLARRPVESVAAILQRVLVDDPIRLTPSVRGSVRTVLCRQSPEVIDAFSARLCARDERKRFLAARTLHGVTTCGREVQRRLIDLLLDQPQIRDAAARTLVTLCPSTVPRLVEHWEETADPSLRERLGLILTFRPDIRAADVWLWGLRHSNRLLCRRSATALRSAHGCSARMTTCLTHLLKAAIPTLEWEAQALLSGWTDLPRLVPRLLDAIEHPGWNVRQSALRALGCVPDLGQNRERIQALVVAIYYDARERWEVRRAAGSIFRSVFRRRP